VSHGSALAAGYSSSATNAPNDVNGTAIRADLAQPFGFMQGRLLGSFSKTDQNFFNPFGTIAIPGAQTGRGAVELTPHKGTKIKFGFTDERNRTSLVNNQRQTGSFEVKQFLTEHLSLAAGYDYRDFQDTLNASHVDSNEVNAGLEWRPTSKLSASVKREQNLTASDPTYPNETLLSARYQVNETVRLFLTQRFSSAPIIPIADLSTTGLVTPSGKNETSLGIEDKWSRYTSLTSGYLIENGINGTDSYAVIGLVNRIPLQEHFSIDLGLQRGQLLTGKAGSFDSGTIGFGWLPVKSFKMSTRYEVRDQGGIGQIFTTGAAGRLSDGVTLLGRYQVSSAAFQPGSGAIDLLSPLSTNPVLSQQTSANLGTAAVAWRNWKTDREGVLFSWTLRTSDLTGVNTTLPQNDRVQMLMTDAYYQPHRRIELYGKFAVSDRDFNYVGSAPEQTLTYLYQGRTQFRISRRFDAAVEGRFVVQPVNSIDQWTVGIEGGFWVLKDLRVGLGYNFKSADEIAANFLTNPVRQGVYFVLSSKLSNMFNLFNPGECKCAPAPAAVLPPAPKPVPVIRISAITGAHDVCPGENLRLDVTASGWLPEQTPVYQWSIDGQAVPGATGPFLMVPTAGGSGLKAISVKVSAGDLSATSDPVNVTVKTIGPPTIQFSASPTLLAYGDKAALTANATASECAAPATITYTASEGSMAGAVFDSTGVAFDMNNRAKPQLKVVHLTATATDRIGQTASAPADVTVTLTPEARRLDDIVFANNDARVNNCGKRLLLEELTPMLRDDPDAKVVLIGHRDTGERANGVDEQRVLNAAAVLSAGKGICPQLDLSRIFVNWVGTQQASETRPMLCGASTRVTERPGQAIAASDGRAQFRRVEIWFVPAGAEMPAGVTGIRAVPAAGVTASVTAKGCPK
jgi:outer membrane protein OmpA-like peptidoglycan-associated protein